LGGTAGFSCGGSDGGVSPSGPMFESLAEKIQGVFARFRGERGLTEENVAEALRDVRRALLEADVNLSVVKAFMAAVREKALGHAVGAGLTPAQTLVKVVHEELVSLMGGEAVPLARHATGITVILMAGLQGSGKTTTAAKLALLLKKQGFRPLLAACDTYRPAAVTQLQTLGRQIDVPVYAETGSAPLPIASAALREAKADGRNYLIVDTAGRLHVDDALMAEIRQMREVLQPQEVLLVVDAMIGQDAVNMAKAFHETLPLTGLVLTKLDGDTRGGAALSVRHVTGCPIKYAGISEKPDGLVPFHPERIASRILGMGDVLTLIERAQATISEQEAKALEAKMLKAEFNLEDFATQMRQMRQIGSMSQILEMLPIPGLKQSIGQEQLSEGEDRLKGFEVIIQSMTPKERRQPRIIDMSRKIRIARGAGVKVEAVNKLLKDFDMMNKMMKQFAGLSKQMPKHLQKSLKSGQFPQVPSDGGFPFPMPGKGKFPFKFPK
jgi:signal recognition particle subunit SRP54